MQIIRCGGLVLTETPGKYDSIGCLYQQHKMTDRHVLQLAVSVSNFSTSWLWWMVVKLMTFYTRLEFEFSVKQVKSQHSYCT